MVMHDDRRILIVEDDPGVALLERRRLERAGHQVTLAETADEAMAKVRAGGIALILLDYRLPGDTDGLDFCTALREVGFDIPVILVTGFSSEATVIKAIRANVRDYVTKSVDYLEYLPGAVARILKQVGMERQLANSEAQLAAIVGSARDAILTVENDQRVSLFNPAAETMFGCRAAEAIGKPVTFFIPGGLPDDSLTECQGVRLSGEVFPIEISRAATELPDRKFLTLLVRDITERKRTDEALRKNQDFLRTIIDNEPECVKLVAADGTLLEINAAGLAMIEAESLEAVIGHSIFRIIAPEHLEAFQLFHANVCQGQRGILEFEIIGLRGTRRWMQTHAAPFRHGPGGEMAHLAITRDISEQRRLEAQFHQSQKMESIGRLAGGVAHDFNNILTVIIGYCELLLDCVPANTSENQMLSEIYAAGQRAANLTRQLLAYSRKQLLDATMLNLNNLMAELQEMLQRLIGEKYEICCDLGSDLWPIHADATQLQQVIMNLAVNARDAMPAGGKIIFKTSNVVLDDARVRLLPEVKTGSYAMLTVMDTGCGMDPGTLARIFEPFFTTKAPDKGTGLGLAVVDGIIRQSGGYVFASSALLQGTTITIYLPRYLGDHLAANGTVPALARSRGTETILFVEDEEGVRKLTTEVLRQCGYTVLEAPNASIGLQLAAAHGASIHLLVTDVIMPGMSGKELSARLVARYPKLKVLFVSGYTSDIISPHGVLESGTAFLQKPFSPAGLAKKVRQMLDTSK